MTCLKLVNNNIKTTRKETSSAKKFVHDVFRVTNGYLFKSDITSVTPNGLYSSRNEGSLQVCDFQSNYRIHGDAAHLDAFSFLIEADSLDEKFRHGKNICGASIRASFAREFPSIASYFEVIYGQHKSQATLYVFIKPFDVKDESDKHVRFLAGRVEFELRKAFEWLGIKVFQSNRGIVSLGHNFVRKRKIRDKLEFLIKRLSAPGAPLVMSEIRKALMNHPAVRGMRRKDFFTKGESFAINSKVDLAFSRLYNRLLGRKNMALTTTFDELESSTGVNRRSLKKYLVDNPCAWLDVKHQYGRLSLKLKPTEDYTIWADETIHLEGSSESFRAQDEWKLSEPEAVIPTEIARTDFIWRTAVILKTRGFERARALQMVCVVASRLPKSQSSEVCRDYHSIVSAIYENQDGYGCYQDLHMPPFLEEIANSNTDTRQVLPNWKKIHIEYIPKERRNFEALSHGVEARKKESKPISLFRESEGSSLRNSSTCSHSEVDDTKWLDLLRNYLPEAARTIEFGKETQVSTQQPPTLTLLDRLEPQATSDLSNTRKVQNQQIMRLSEVRAQKLRNGETCKLNRFAAALASAETYSDEKALESLLQSTHEKWQDTHVHVPKQIVHEKKHRRLIASFLALPPEVREKIVRG